MNQVKGNGASSTLFQHDRPNHPNRSKFDLSRIVNFSADPGMIVPIDVIPTLPNDTFHISIKLALDTLPLVQTSLTNYKILTHWYYIKNRDLWKGWKTFVTKGRTGNINLTVPKVDLSQPIDNFAPVSEMISVDGVDGPVDGYHYAMGHHSLASFFGVPPFYSGKYNVVGDDVVLSKDYLPYTFIPTGAGLTDAQKTAYINACLQGFGNYPKVNALPFVAYQNIVKNNYVTPNLLQGNTALFPEQGDDDWLLPYTVENNIANYISGKSSLTSSDKINFNGVYSSNETDVDLRLLRYALWDDDYFTTGLPWLQRGEVQTLDVTTSLDNAFEVTGNGSILGDLSVQFPSGIIGSPNRFQRPFIELSTDYNSNHNALADFYVKQNHRPNGAYEGASNGSVGEFQVSVPVGDISKLLSVNYNGQKVQASMTANQLRELIAMSVWQERNARVDGSYNKMIFQHWQNNPKSEEHKPIYIGGTADYLNFSTVIQNSENTDTSHLGDTAGFGSASGSGDVGTFNCDDYGFIIGVMIIKPNTTYTQGVEHYLFDDSFEDYPQPEFEGLSPEPILNKELFVQGNNFDDDLFCYQERYTYLKVRQNVNRGLFQVKPTKDLLFGAFTQSRWFENLPKLSYQFCCMSPDNIRRDWLAYPIYPTFRVQLLSNVFATRSLAYSSQPNTFGF